MESMTQPSGSVNAGIFKALALARSKFQIIAKSATNPHFKSKYATLEDYISATAKALCEHGLAVIQRVESDASGNMSLRTLLCHESGQQVELGLYPVIPVQATPQGYGSALSYARRYSYSSGLNLAAEDDDGNDASETKRESDQDKPVTTYGDTPACPKCQTASKPSKFPHGPRYWCPSVKCKVPGKDGKAQFYGFDVREPGVDDGVDAVFGKLHEDAIPESLPDGRPEPRS